MDRAEIQRVMELAAEIFAEHGFSGTGMRELCKRCGIGPPTLYHYFGSKEQLFNAVCVEKYRGSLAEAREVLSDELSAGQQLEVLVDKLFDLLVNDRVLSLLLRRDLIEGSISGRVLDSRPQYHGILDLLESVILRHSPRSNARRLAFTVASLIFGYCEFVHISLNIGDSVGAEALEERRHDLLAALRKLVLEA